MSPTKQNVRSTPFELQVRKDARFDFSQLENAIHTEGNLYISHFFNALSLATPITEGILIRAIRKSQPLLENSGLEVDAQAFIGQEATHTREHRALNRRLLELGFDLEEALAGIESEVKKMEESMSLQRRLALVVTGEHAIYAVARALLTSAYTESAQQAEVKGLFVWHSLEEMEHQSVCDDIYSCLYGKGMKHKLLYYRTFISAGRLLARMVRTLMKALLEQSRKPREGERKEFITWLFRNPGVGTTALKETLGFFSPGFLHWQRANEDQKLIADNLAAVYDGKFA